MISTSLQADSCASPIANRIESEAQALEIAHAYAEKISLLASERDRQASHPYGELQELALSGLLGVTVPRSHGGAGLAGSSLGRILQALARTDPAIAQIPQNHFVCVKALMLSGTPEQQSFFFKHVLDGARFGNGMSERGTPNNLAFRTTIKRNADGTYTLSGEKYYCTGALSAQWIPIYALDEYKRVVIAYVPRDTPNLHVKDDWAGMGQRATASGTVILDHVAVPADFVIPHWRAVAGPNTYTAYARFLHGAIDVGIAENALRDASEFVMTKSRPSTESGLERASDDQWVVHRCGQLTTKLHVAEALVARAGRLLDEADACVNEISVNIAAVAVGEAKAYAADAAVEISGELFALAGTSAADEKHNLHRHWRNARTHSLHDPARWNYHRAGVAFLHGQPPRDAYNGGLKPAAPALSEKGLK